MGNKIVFALGIIFVIGGVLLIFSSGVDLRNLPFLDITADLRKGTVTATDISQESETKIISGAVIALIGIIMIGIGK